MGCLGPINMLLQKVAETASRGGHGPGISK